MVPPRGDMHGTETSVDTQGHSGAPHQVHPPILGTRSGQTPSTQAMNVHRVIRK